MNCEYASVHFDSNRDCDVSICHLQIPYRTIPMREGNEDNPITCSIMLNFSFIYIWTRRCFMNEQSSQFIALYCRVSTDDQVKEGVSLEEQQERLEAYCRAMGWGNVVVYVEDGFSAKSIDRPHLTRLIEDVKAGDIKKIIVTKLDRMSRKLLDLLTLIDLFQEHDVSFVSISESFDTNTPSGRLTLQVLGAVAEFEENAFANASLKICIMLLLKENGTQHPFGYRLENKELVIYENEAKNCPRYIHMVHTRRSRFLCNC